MTGSLPSSVGGLLDHARAVLDQRLPLATTEAARAAALLARCALEDTIHDLCQTAGADVPEATMRSRLTAIRVLCGDPTPPRPPGPG